MHKILMYVLFFYRGGAECIKFDHQLLKGTVTILVLRLLQENDMYGYQIIKELEQRSQNVFELNEGALYPILHKLENNGCLESYWDETNSSRKRKYYHITSKGGMLLKDKTHEWNFFSKAVDIVLNSAIFDAVVTFPNALVNILEEKVCIKLFQIM